jgi:hypothetical protein
VAIVAQLDAYRAMLAAQADRFHPARDGQARDGPA